MHGRRFLLFALAVLMLSAVPAEPVAAQPSGTPPSMKKWLGTWHFGECWPTLNKGASDCLDYELRISQVGGQTTADLDMNGFQTMSSFKCEVRPTSSGIGIVFAGIREPGLWGDTRFKPGDELFELFAKDGKVLTAWGKLTPALDKNKRTGVRFERD